MFIATLGWFIAGICIAAFIALWFFVSYKELSTKLNSLESISEQVQLHRKLYMQERGSANNAAARNVLDNKLIVYREIAKEYDALINKPINYIPAYIMGFRHSNKAKNK